MANTYYEGSGVGIFPLDSSTTSGQQDEANKKKKQRLAQAYDLNQQTDSLKLKKQALEQILTSDLNKIKTDALGRQILNGQQNGQQVYPPYSTGESGEKNLSAIAAQEAASPTSQTPATPSTTSATPTTAPTAVTPATVQNDGTNGATPVTPTTPPNASGMTLAKQWQSMMTPRQNPVFAQANSMYMPYQQAAIASMENTPIFSADRMNANAMKMANQNANTVNTGANIGMQQQQMQMGLLTNVTPMANQKYDAGTKAYSDAAQLDSQAEAYINNANNIAPQIDAIDAQISTMKTDYDKKIKKAKQYDKTKLEQERDADILSLQRTRAGIITEQKNQMATAKKLKEQAQIQRQNGNTFYEQGNLLATSVGINAGQSPAMQQPIAQEENKEPEQQPSIGKLTADMYGNVNTQPVTNGVSGSDDTTTTTTTTTPTVSSSSTKKQNSNPIGKAFTNYQTAIRKYNTAPSATVDATVKNARNTLNNLLDNMKGKLSTVSYKDQIDILRKNLLDNKISPETIKFDISKYPPYSWQEAISPKRIGTDIANNYTNKDKVDLVNQTPPPTGLSGTGYMLIYNDKDDSISMSLRGKLKADTTGKYK